MLKIHAIKLLTSAALIISSAIASDAFNAPTSFEGANMVVSVKPVGEQGEAEIVNAIIGATSFYGAGVYGENVKIANVEGGIGWTNHDFYKNANVGETIIPDGAKLEDLYTTHATGIGAIMSGYLEDQTLEIPYYMAFGIAPKSQISFGSVTRAVNADGTFEINMSDFHKVYSHFFTAQSDVINSSWGPSQTTASDYLPYYMDAQTNANSKTTLVLAAGNSGSAANTVSSMALAQNAIVVGALGNPNAFDEIADYSSRSPSDFYNPVTKQTISNVRAAVHITAPGSGIAIAFYEKTEPTVTDYYAVADGTSFAAPTVGGVVALLKSTSYQLEANQSFVDAGWNANARDSRVIKAVLLNSAAKPAGWDNGQKTTDNVEFKIEVSKGSYYTSSFNNVVKTTQALDYTYGAGMLDANAAMNQYVGMYTSGNANNVWLMNDVERGTSNMYKLGMLDAGTEITATLVWFVDAAFATPAPDAPPLDTPDIGECSFSDLTLEVWIYENEAYTPIAISDSSYDSIEHLSVTVASLGEYFIRVTFFEMVYGDKSNETFALAWTVPEPADVAMLLALAIAAACFFKRSAGRRA